MASNVQAAIQAAALADNYAFGAEIAAREGLTGICLHCALTTATATFFARPWPLCDACRELLEPSLVTYRLGAPSNGGTTFNDWSQLVNAIQHPGPKTIAFDTTYAPIRIPPGTWDVAGAAIIGHDQTPVTLDGAQLQNPSALHDLKLVAVNISSQQNAVIRAGAYPLFISNCDIENSTVQA